MKLNNKFKIGKTSIVSGKVFIIAEMACAHGGSLIKARKIIDAAKDAKADAIQLEIYTPDETCIPGTEENKELRQVYFSRAEWIGLFKYARKKKLNIISFCYDFGSLLFSIKNNVDAIKVNSSDLLNLDFLNYLPRIKIPITLGTGSSKITEIKKAVNYLYKKNKNIKLILMHGGQNFPTDIRNERINKLDILRNIFKCNIGYANHTAGHTKIAKYIDLIAIGKSISVLEKHITVKRSLRDFDYYSSLEPREFKEYVKSIRTAEDANNYYKGFEITDSDRKYRIFQKKSIVISKKVSKGQKITKKNILFIRNMVVEGMPPINYLKIKNLIFKKDLPKFTVLKKSHLIK